MKNLNSLQVIPLIKIGWSSSAPSCSIPEAKVLSCWQAQWLEFLSQFNLVICSCPGKLGGKLDALTRRWDVYPKEGDSGYTRVNPQTLQPVFTQEQLTNSLCVTYLEFPVLHAVMIMDVEILHSNILSALPSDPIAQIHLAGCNLHMELCNDTWGLRGGNCSRPGGGARGGRSGVDLPT